MAKQVGAMAGEVRAAVLQGLVQYLIDLSTNLSSLIYGLDGEAQNLSQNLLTIQQFLNDAETRTITSGDVKIWLKRLENAAFEADNVLDKLHYYDLSSKLNTGITKKKVLIVGIAIQVPKPIADITRKRKMGDSIEVINTKLKSINESATQLGLHKKLADAPTVPYAGMETDSVSADPIFIGRDEVVSKIVETLITSVATHHERVFSILPIVGMGGLGKTTLTRNVFHHQNIETRFGSRIWVHVSHVFDPITLFNKILKELTSSQSGQGEISRQEILTKLQEALKDKTYLLVLDDVWNEDVSKWEDFLNSLSGVTTTKGNGIIVTTRNTEVASIEGALDIHELEGLSKEDCWKIIRAKTFGNKGVPLDFDESVGREIAERCGGLPLAASVVGGVLRCDKSADKWVSIRDDWLPQGEEEGENNITKILRLSFNNLSSPSLKKCFAYCSIFPKGYIMEKEELIEMWMGEGFLGSNGDMESVGDKFYNVLLHSSLLQNVESYEERCVMHDLVHDLASSVLGNADGVSRVRYLIHEEGISSPIKKEVAQHLRTLIFEADQPFDDNIFSDFKSLHVLILKGTSFEELPTSIRTLIHLRNLNITETEITHLPDWIGALHHLQTIRASDIEKLPSTIKYLINLRRLHVDDEVEVELPTEIGRLTSLQTLPGDVFSVRDKNGYKIEELGSLNNLKGSLTIQCLEKVHDKEEAEKANLSKKSKLSKLRLEWGCGREDVESSSDESVLESDDVDREEVESINDEKVLEGLQPHSNLKNLFIWRFRGKRFPEWTMNMAVRNEPQGSWIGLKQLVEIEFNRCTKCEEIPMLGHLPNLKSLSFRGLRNVKSIKSSFYGIGNETGVVFPMLETLILFNMDSLEEWAEVESGSTSEVEAFPHLQSLKISNCNQLMKVPVLGHLPNLKSLSFRGLRNVKSINSSFYGIGNETGVVFPVLETLELSDMDSLEEWAEVESGSTSEVEAFPHLHSLKISNCNQLMKVPVLGHLPNLKSLSFWGLRNVKSINSSIYGIGNETGVVFPVLETLELSDMDSLKEWAELESGGTSEVKVFPHLRSLKISNCNQLMKVPINHFSSDLRSLEIRKCHYLREIPDGLQTLNSLETLVIEECRDLKRIGCSSGGSLTSLVVLIIRECHGLMDLPNEMVESLSALVLKRVVLKGLSSLRNLPRVIECLAKSAAGLKELRIVGVPKFVATSVDQVWHLPKLHTLEIDVEGSRETSVTTGDRILQGCNSNSLHWLSLMGVNSWECLPESIQHLISLDRLSLYNFGMEELPKWFDQYISRVNSRFGLDLFLYECKRLRRLPSTPAMRHLINQNKVYIKGCPKLQQQSDDGSEQPTFSHIH